jgi:hypothetical protein
MSATRRTIYGSLTLAIAFTSMEVRATETPTTHDDRYYEVVIVNGITWEDAKKAAEERTHDGIQGHLATIGSADEDLLVHQLRQQAVTDGGELWVGGYQVQCATPTPEPKCGWLWLNGEAISPVNSASPYTNWLPGEPNNRPGPTPASEDHLAIGLDNAFGWNDEGSLPNIRGYVVEYGDKVTVPATTCTADGPGCNPTGAQVLQYPATATVAEDATLTARTFRFQDDPERCGQVSLSLFDGAVVIPRYLCGHPDFLVIETHSSGVEVPSGAIRVENLTEVALPDNLYGCDAVRQNPAGEIDPDPSHRDVVAWQASNSADMLETTLGSASDRFRGTVTEVTNGCGSSRGTILQGSYQFVGLRIHPDPDNEYADDAIGNHQSFVDLIRYKLEVLQASVLASKAVLPGASYVALRSHVKNAIKSHDSRQYGSALQSIRGFLKEVAQAKYRPVAGENPSGDHLMRGSNLEFMYTNKLIPFAP